MGKESIINGIIIILMIVSSGILGLGIYSYLATTVTDDNVASIQILENVIPSQENSKTSYSMEPLEVAGSTIVSSHTKPSFEGSKYYYNQLGQYAKVVYQAFENHIEDLKTGEYRIQFQNEFNELLKQENGNDILNDEFQRAWDAFSYDRPDVFYLNPNKFSIIVETNRNVLKTTYRVYIDKGDNATYLNNGFSSKEEINECIHKMDTLKQQFVEQMSVMNSDYEKVKALHDWIVDSIEYDTNMQQENRYNVYGALIDRRVVCEGYAKLLKYILDEIGMECVLVSGTGVNSEGQSERHMWNDVKIDGQWYAIDCTWDDPIMIGGGKANKDLKYQYFLKGVNFYQDHREEPITDKSTDILYPKIAQQDY